MWRKETTRIANTIGVRYFESLLIIVIVIVIYVILVILVVYVILVM